MISLAASATYNIQANSKRAMQEHIRYGDLEVCFHLGNSLYG